MTATSRLLVCTDLDRTLIPNGEAPESLRARPLLSRLAARPEVVLCYVSGRGAALIREAISDYGLPEPDYAIGDVGTTIHAVEAGRWRPIEDWDERIAADWRGQAWGDLERALRGVPGLRLQEPGKQNRWKLSGYVEPYDRIGEVLASVRERLDPLGIRYCLIASHDEVADLGLLDCLPERATKYHAVDFVRRRLGFDPERTVFAGDSGNDLPVLTSGLPSVLVANAAPAVRDEAIRRLRERGMEDRLYIARGGWFGMNGNYCAGVLEGIVHFFPEAGAWLEAAR